MPHTREPDLDNGSRRLYTDTEDHTVHFHQLQRGTADRIRNRRVNERTGKENQPTGKEVDSNDIVKGYELDEGQYVIVEPDEPDEIAPGRSQTIEISEFVDLGQMEAGLLRPHLLPRPPRGKEYQKVY